VRYNTYMEPHLQKRHRRAIATDPRVRPVAPQNSVWLKAFYRFLPSISAFFRRRRMIKFVNILKIEPGNRVLDLGGAPAIWEHVAVPLDITLLNLPGAVSPGEFDILKSPNLRHHTFRVRDGDACNVEKFGNCSFDLVFSNSVIEHVGPSIKQAEFAREVRRLGKACWVQTPSKWFPIEAHSGMPFYWFYPKWLKAALIRSWRPEASEMVERLHRHDPRAVATQNGRVVPEWLSACRILLRLPQKLRCVFARMNADAESAVRIKRHRLAIVRFDRF